MFQRDAVLAKQVFILVFKAIKEEIKDICTCVSSAVLDILNSSKHCVPALIGTLLEIIFADTAVFAVKEARLIEGKHFILRKNIFSVLIVHSNNL